MRIAIIGNSGTGKTTLAESLAARLRVPLVPEFARTVMQEWGMSTVHGVAPELMAKFQIEILARKLPMERAAPAFVADRSTADSAVIWLTRLAGLVDPDISARTVELCREGIDVYDYLFLLPGDVFPLSDDGVRQTDWSKRFLFDIALRGLLELWNRPYIVIGAVSLENRLEEVEHHLRHDPRSTA